jgi:hypothetical protein
MKEALHIESAESCLHAGGARYEFHDMEEPEVLGELGQRVLPELLMEKLLEDDVPFRGIECSLRGMDRANSFPTVTKFGK